MSVKSVETALMRLCCQWKVTASSCCLCRDNVEWDEEQQREAERTVEENSQQKIPPEQQSKL